MKMLLLVAVSALAQEPPKPDANVEKLDAVMTSVEAYLKTIPSFRVEVATTWSVEGPQPRTGGGSFALTVSRPGQYRLETTTPGSATAFVCACDGKKLRHAYQSAKNGIALHSVEEPAGLGHLAEERMTASLLSGTGLDLLALPNLHEHVLTTASKVKYVGEVDLAGTKAHHFQAAWESIPEVEFWIRTGTAPVLLQTKRTVNLTPNEKMPRLIKSTNKLTWKVGEVAQDSFALKLPADSVEVRDIYTYLREGGTRELAGKAAPVPDLKLADGKAWQLAPHKDKEVVVLFFWASWAAPSIDDMPRVLKFIRENQQKGVAFYAINAGEKEEAARAFLTRTKYDAAVVFDPDQKAARAYRVTALPVTVLIAKDGTIQAAHVGAHDEARELIKGDVEKLLKGERLTPPEK